MSNQWSSLPNRVEEGDTQVHSRLLYDHKWDVRASVAESILAEWERFYRLPVPTHLAVGLFACNEGVGRACMAD